MQGSAASAYLRLLWKIYNYQLLLVVATLASLIVESVLAETWSTWRLAPQGLLAVCIIYFAGSAGRLFSSTYPNPALAYAVCTGKSPAWFEAAQRQIEARLEQDNIHWRAVRREYGIHSSDWAFVDQSSLTRDSAGWLGLARNLLAHFWELPKRVDRVPVYHFFFVCPPSISFAFGAHVGRDVAHAAYHFIPNAKQPYFRVVDTSCRDTSQGMDEANRRIPPVEFKQIIVDRESGSSDGTKNVLVLNFTNHKLTERLPGTEHARELIRVSHRDGIGHLPTDDWVLLSREIMSVVLTEVERGLPLDLWINTPVTLGFMIGALTGPVKGITLCEHNVFLDEPVRCFELTAPELQRLHGERALGPVVERPAGMAVRQNNER